MHTYLVGSVPQFDVGTIQVHIGDVDVVGGGRGDVGRVHRLLLDVVLGTLGGTARTVVGGGGGRAALLRAGSYVQPGENSTGVTMISYTCTCMYLYVLYVYTYIQYIRTQ